MRLLNDIIRDADGQVRRAPGLLGEQHVETELPAVCSALAELLGGRAGLVELCRSCPQLFATTETEVTGAVEWMRRHGVDAAHLLHKAPQVRVRSRCIVQLHL